MKKLLALATLGIATCVSSQSLGDPRAEAWIGQALMVTVPAGLELGGKEDCVYADVFYGDNRVSAAQVRAALVGQGSARRVRIEADQPIDEPVVTVTVRAGCGNTLTRSYTLLPELPSATMLAAAHPPPAPFQPGGRASLALATQMAGAPAARAVRAAQEVANPRPAAPMVIKRRTREVQPALATRGPRLQVEAWEPDAATLLRVSSTLLSPVRDNERATAALMWQAINAGPEQILRTAATLQQLEGEMAQLRQVAGQTQSEMLALRRDLEQPAVFGVPARAMQMLALVLALAAATAAFLWYRAARGGSGRWSGAPIDAMLDGLGQGQQPAANHAAFAPATVDQPVLPVPASGPAPEQRAPASRAPAAAPAPAVQRPPLPVRSPSATMLRVETLSATFEEVDFLASLGLWNDAMDILKTYLEDSAAPAPIAYYELMRLCVNLDDAASLVQVRKRYAQVFGVESPKFEQINTPLGLENYPDLVKRICGAWGTPEALDFIELSLFTVAPAGKAYSLQAGRDLLFLHDLAMAQARESGTGAGAEDDLHAIAPWARSEDPEQVRLGAEEAGEAAGGHRFGLDLDLSAEAPPEAQRAPSELAPLELTLEPPDAPASRLDPFHTGAAALPGDDDDPFSAAVASERIIRRN
ncbi:hypothetical protein LZ009_08195 [Ramlibacter sp. XY19]|uniref:hypothetical protein n=1 Tax=Ramlibacter paludis TaxID=2908000 RepID=UPI0023DB23AD|nr:hypothetical protein [Ramlibacter paludis]MCG2592762.1 hypothetical protein [Ramlibacter paludis]